MKRFLRDYFSFSRSETRMMVILSCLIFATLLIRYYGPQWQVSGDWVAESDDRDIQDFISTLKAVESSPKRSSSRNKAEKSIVLTLAPAPFDPNTADEAELSALGLSGFITNNILKFRAAGGRFNTVGDFSRIYGLKPEDFEILRPYIKIKLLETKGPPGENKPNSRKFSSRRVFDPDFTVELNSADTTQLIRIRGIGEVLAGRIIKYRELLGGYADPLQLGEVFGLSDSLVRANAGHFITDTSCIKKISLNHSDFGTFLRHPYLDRDMVKAIFKFRQFAGREIEAGDLKTNGILNDSAYQRILPYLEK